MTRLHFQPIQGKALDILDTILKNEEVASADDVWGKLSVVVEELVLNIVDYANSDYLDVEIIRDEKSITLRFRDGGDPFNHPAGRPQDRWPWHLHGCQVYGLSHLRLHGGREYPDGQEECNNVIMQKCNNIELCHI